MAKQKSIVLPTEGNPVVEYTQIILDPICHDHVLYLPGDIVTLPLLLNTKCAALYPLESETELEITTEE